MSRSELIQLALSLSEHKSDVTIIIDPHRAIRPWLANDHDVNLYVQNVTI